MAKLMVNGRYLSKDQQRIGAVGREGERSPSISYPGGDNEADGSDIAL
jgi:hypothetical protein